MSKNHFCALAISLSLASIASGQDAFSDESASLGLTFEHQDGPFGMGMGGGAAWFDMELDGDEDLFTIGSAVRHGMFRNDGGNFVEMGQTTGLDVTQFGATLGVAAADYDNDGLTDLLLTNSGPNQLYRNHGDGTFTEEGANVGVDAPGWSTSAAWADFDLDGDLDTYVGNYVESMSFPYHVGAANNLFINSATAGTAAFVDMAPSLGVDNVGIFGPSLPGYPYIAPTGQPTAGCTLSVCTLDVDEDGDPDILVGNDFGAWVMSDAFFRNDMDLGAGLAFTDISAATGFDAAPMYNMGISPADYDHDGDWDFYMSNLGDNRLFRNDGGVFVDVAAQAGVLDGVHPVSGELITSWGTSFGDVNNDGWEDIIVVNGYIPAALFLTNEKRAANHLYINNQDGTFTEVLEANSGMADEMVGRGIAVTDLNRDGFLDHYVMNNGDASVALPGDHCRYYENTGSLANPGADSWLELRLVGRYGNTSALGARIDLTAGGTTWKRQVLGDPVYVSSSSRVVHFGLGAVRFADRIEIDWSRGTHQELVHVPTGNYFELIEPSVLLDGIDAPVWSGGTSNGTYTLRAHVRNQSKIVQSALVTFNLHRGVNGPLAMSVPMTVKLQPGEARDVDLIVPATAALHAALQGTILDERVYVTADRAIDSRAQEVLVP